MGRHKLQGAGSFYLRIGVLLYAQEFICRVMPVSYEKQGTMARYLPTERP
jgi:hypothetical protein